MTKYKVGDQVRVVNYGSWIWEWRAQRMEWVDISPELVGQTGVVVDAHKTQEIDQYKLKGPNKVAWYHNDQLELIYRPEYE
jgi:hypothetical protein